MKTKFLGKISLLSLKGVQFMKKLPFHKPNSECTCDNVSKIERVRKKRRHFLIWNKKITRVFRHARNETKIF